MGIKWLSHKLCLILGEEFVEINEEDGARNLWARTIILAEKLGWIEVKTYGIQARGVETAVAETWQNGNLDENLFPLSFQTAQLLKYHVLEELSRS